MQPFVFSCDAHIAEPATLFTERMPDGLKQFAITSRAEDGIRVTRIGEQVVLKLQMNFHEHRTGYDNHNPNEASATTKRRGARDLALRLEDMKRDGVDAELVFPTLGLMIPRIADREGQRAACRVYNDWAWEYTAPVRQQLIPAAIIPADFDYALAECERTAAMGYAAFCIQEGLNNYNDPRWDPIFALSAREQIPVVFHTGVGPITLRTLKGPGAALFNYTRQMNDAVDVITQLVGGGVLDRNPNAHIVFAEHSAGWLLGLAERMDEVYQGHAPYIQPKLSRLPSQIVREQVHCSLQNDVGSLMTRRGVGIDALMFATDYPHSEGTFPYSRDVVKRLNAENADASEEEIVAVLGGTAAKIFKRADLQAAVAERRSAPVAA
jgi:predicted TIM-barrel fold metal-dependent hydrolase